MLRLDRAFPAEVVVTNEISDLLAAARVWSHHERYSVLLPPSEKQLACARLAHELDTTLWFERKQQLDDVVATGQGTLCLNLLVHLQARRAAAPGDARLEALERRLAATWEQLTRDPYSLL
jgi:hypothetical protein